MVNRAHRDQRGLVGKFMIVWLLLLAVIVLVGYDAVSIAITTFKVSDVAAQAASDAVVEYRHARDLTAACAVAQATDGSSASVAAVTSLIGTFKRMDLGLPRGGV